MILGSNQGARALEPATRILACLQDDKDEEMRVYADYLSGLLQGQSSYLEVPAKGGVQRINKEASDCDLLVLGEPKQSLLKR